MVQVIVERRRRVTHAGHRERISAGLRVMHARKLRLRLLLVRRHSLLRVVLVRILGLLLVMVVVGVTYILIIAVAVMSHGRTGRPGRYLQIPEPIAEVRFANHIRWTAAAVDHRSAPVRVVAAKVWHRSSTVGTSSASSATTPSSSVVTAEPRVVTAAAVLLLLRLLLGRGGLLRNEYRGVCGEVVARSRGPQRGKARFRTALPLATSALLVHSCWSFLESVLSSSSGESVLRTLLFFLYVTQPRNRQIPQNFPIARNKTKKYPVAKKNLSRKENRETYEPDLMATKHKSSTRADDDDSDLRR